jgi:outer membrane protein TolC
MPIRHRRGRARPVATIAAALTLLTGAAVARGEPAEALSLRQALDRAARLNPRLVAAEAETDRTRAAFDEARAGRWPSLFGTATFTQLDSDRIVGGHPIVYATTGSASLTMVAPIVQARQWSLDGSARREVEIAVVDGADVRRRVMAEVASAYLAVNTAKRAVSASEIALRHAQRHLEIARARRDAGGGTALDETRASQEVERIAVDLVAAKRAVVDRQEVVGLLIGASGAIDTTEEPSFAAVVPPTAVELSMRTDLQLARDRLDLADYVRRTTWTEWLPSLNVIGSLFVDSPGTALLPASGWSVQLALGGRLFDGGATAARTRAREAQERQRRSSYDAQQLLAASEVRRSGIAIRLGIEGLASAEQSAAAAEHALDLVSNEYREGVGTNIGVIDAEQRFHDATLEVARARQALEQARLDLLIASGRTP